MSHTVLVRRWQCRPPRSGVPVLLADCLLKSISILVVIQLVVLLSEVLSLHVPFRGLLG